MLKDIDINFFKSITHLKIEDFKRINLFVGKNNASKTTVLEALLLTVGISNPELIVNINNLRGAAFNQADDFRLIFNNLEYENNVKIVANFDTQKREFFIEALKDASVLPNRINGTNGQNNFQLKNTSTTIQASFNQLKINFSIKEPNIREKRYSSKITFNDEKGLDIDLDKIYKEKYNGLIISSRSFFYSNFAKSLENLIITKKEKVLIDYLAKIDDRILDIKIGINNMIYFDVGLPRLIPVHLIGDGVIKLMNILLAIIDYKNGFLFIDEIDNGLHYSVLKNLWKLIFDVSKAYNTQLFISTHDFETLKYLKEVLEEDNYAQFQEEVRSYTLKRDIKNNLKVYGYKFPEFENSIEQGIEIR